jgi:hypothetical protein
MYLTFTPSKGSTIVPNLVKCLAIVVDALLLLLMVWAIVNMCYPFWGWIIYASTWVGIIFHLPIVWLIENYSLRSFIAAKFHRAGQVQYYGSHGSHKLKHLGLFFSVWDAPDALLLARYDEHDEVICPKTRSASLANIKMYRKWLGWSVVLLTDAIPFVLLAALLIAGFFFGIGTIMFFMAGALTAEQVITLILRFSSSRIEEETLLLDGKLCTRKFLGMQMCVLEGPNGELLLIHYTILLFNLWSKSRWHYFESYPQCGCCQSLVKPV